MADLQKLFVRGIAKSRGQGSLTLTPEAVLQLESYSFPGNIKVRMLKSPLGVLSFHNLGLVLHLTKANITAASNEAKVCLLALPPCEASFHVAQKAKAVSKP